MSWFEDPVSSDDLEGLRLIRERTPRLRNRRTIRRLSLESIVRSGSRSCSRFPQTYIFTPHTLAFCPVRRLPVVVMNLLTPGGIRHIRPVVSIESRCAFKLRFIRVEDETLPILIHGQRTPRDRKEFISHPDETAVRQ